MDAATQYALAYVLSSTAGLRVFVTLLAVALALRLGLLPAPAQQFAWLGSQGALVVLGIASVLEVLGDKIPFVDHALQLIHTVAKPLAGALIVGTVVAPDNDPSAILLAVLGGANALGVHAVSATARAASTATTGGLANPMVSTIEDVVTLGGLTLAWFAPLAGASILIILTIIGLILMRRLVAYVASRRERRTTAVSGM
jgi:uncharacterized membrane protein